MDQAYLRTRSTSHDHPCRPTASPEDMQRLLDFPSETLAMKESGVKVAVLLPVWRCVTGSHQVQSILIVQIVRHETRTMIE
jgi:hypothetical protein